MSFYYNLTVEDIQEQADALVEFHSRYAEYFHTKTRDVSPHGLEYLKGQLLCEGRRNMNKMSVKVTEMNEQALSNFISTSPWEEEALIERIGEEAVQLLCRDGEEGALIVDESGIAKQGEKSVGVARQYCGSKGKVDNCQVGVFLAYASRDEATLIDKRLYLPERWINDPQRCREAGVSEEAIVFHTKAEVGLEMTLKAKERGIPFQFVSMDAHYGQQSWLLSRFEGEMIEYMADIPSDTRVYLEYPEIGIPQRKGERGRKPSKVRVLEEEPIEVRKLLEADNLKWDLLKVRDTQRGELWIRFAAIRVYKIEDELPVEKPVWLLIRREIDNSDVKFSFSNAPQETSIEVLAQRQSRRYWVERALEDAKGLAGLDEYQVIGWRGWHHHVSMVLLATLFLLYLKHQLVQKAPMFTLNDAKEILEEVMPKKKLSLEDTVRIIQKKHLNRFRSRNCRLKKQRLWLHSNRFLM